MCYNIRYLTKKKLQYARRFAGNEKDIEDLEEQLRKLGERIGPYYHVTGFDHPDVPVITNEERNKIQLYNWGLIPSWVKDVKKAVELSNRTLNARGEEIFGKISYKKAAKDRRCLVLIDGFFEYHWKNEKSYPHHIELKNGEPMALAGLWETWQLDSEDLIRNTFSIVTTKANALMSHIHNKPKGSLEPRMPLIIPKELEDEWLRPVNDELDIERIQSIVQPYDTEEMKAFPVSRLKGKEAVGNSPEAIEKVIYPELESEQGELF